MNTEWGEKILPPRRPIYKSAGIPPVVIEDSETVAWDTTATAAITSIVAFWDGNLEFQLV